MSDSLQQILNAALELSEDEQLWLFSALQSALEERGLRPFDESWVDEIERRTAEIDGGNVQGLSWADVKRKAPKL